MMLELTDFRDLLAYGNYRYIPSPFVQVSSEANIITTMERAKEMGIEDIFSMSDEEKVLFKVGDLENSEPDTILFYKTYNKASRSAHFSRIFYRPNFIYVIDMQENTIRCSKSRTGENAGDNFYFGAERPLYKVCHELYKFHAGQESEMELYKNPV